MPSPNSDEFHIAYIYSNIMFGQGAWDHPTFQTVWPGLHFYLSWKIFQLSLFWFRERWDQMHRQQLGPTMSGSTWDLKTFSDFFRTNRVLVCSKNSSWRLAGDIWSALNGPMLISLLPLILGATVAPRAPNLRQTSTSRATWGLQQVFHLWRPGLSAAAPRLLTPPKRLHSK